MSDGLVFRRPKHEASGNPQDDAAVGVMQDSVEVPMNVALGRPTCSTGFGTFALDHTVTAAPANDDELLISMVSNVRCAIGRVSLSGFAISSSFAPCAAGGDRKEAVARGRPTARASHGGTILPRGGASATRACRLPKLHHVPGHWEDRQCALDVENDATIVRAGPAEKSFVAAERQARITFGSPWRAAG